jgi:hypothetical protein
MTTPIRAALYLRVSTGRPTTTSRFQTSAAKGRDTAPRAVGRLSASMSSPAHLPPTTGGRNSSA